MCRDYLQINLLEKTAGCVSGKSSIKRAGLGKLDSDISGKAAL
jgi:hypothetical protein